MFLVSRFGGQTLVTFLSDAQFDTFALRQRDVGLDGFADDEHVRQTGGEDMALAILNVNDVEGARVPFTVDNGAHTTQISTAGDHTQVA